MRYIARRMAFVVERVSQTVRSTPSSSSTELCATELCVEIVLPDDVEAATLDLQIDGSQFELSADGGAVRRVCFAKRIDSDRATSKFVRRRKSLIICAPVMAADVHGPQRVRIPAASLGRGTTNVQVSLPRDASEGAWCYVLVSRSGDWADPTAGGYTWCHTFRASAGATVHVAIESSAWVWECPDCCLSYGVLRDSDPHPSIEEGCEQVGVEVRVEPQASPAADDAADCLVAVFTPEEARLPTVQMKRACRLYVLLPRTSCTCYLAPPVLATLHLLYLLLCTSCTACYLAPPALPRPILHPSRTHTRAPPLCQPVH